jgi:hypothetical protein
VFLDLGSEVSGTEHNKVQQPAEITLLSQAYKHVFTSPSSADEDEPRSTGSGNACIHGMTSVTKASLAYIATQVPVSPVLIHPTYKYQYRWDLHYQVQSSSPKQTLQQI